MGHTHRQTERQTDRQGHMLDQYVTTMRAASVLIPMSVTTIALQDFTYLVHLMNTE